MEVSNSKTAKWSKQFLTIEIMFLINLLGNPKNLVFVAQSIVVSQMEMITTVKNMKWAKKVHCFIPLVSHVLLPVICCSVMLLMFQSSRNSKCYFSSWLFNNLKLLNSSPEESYLNSDVSFRWGTQPNSCTLRTMVSSNNLTSHITFLVHMVHVSVRKILNVQLIDSILLSKVAFDLGILQIIIFFSLCIIKPSNLSLVVFINELENEGK